MSDWIQTFTGRRVDPLRMTPDDVAIEDIAHALAMTCRFGGHCRRFYSVAQHSVLVSRLCPTERLLGLIHDAGEAYLVDLPTPVKRRCTGLAGWNFFDNAESHIMAQVASKFLGGDGMPWVMPAEVNRADRLALSAEARRLFWYTEGWNLEAWETFSEDQQQICFEVLGGGMWEPAVANGIFLAEFERLGGRRI